MKELPQNSLYKYKWRMEEYRNGKVEEVMRDKVMKKWSSSKTNTYKQRG